MFRSHQNYDINPMSDFQDEPRPNDNGCSFKFCNNRLMLLLWKNLKLKIRHPLKSIFWMLAPCIFTVIMVIIRMAAERTIVKESTKFPVHGIDETVLVLGLTEKQVLFAPKTNVTQRIMETYQDNTFTAEVIGFDSEEDMIDFYLDKDSDKICCAVVFNEILTDGIDYKLRFPFIPTYYHNDYSMSRLVELTWKTAKQSPRFIRAGPRSPNNTYGGPPDYFNNGFLYVQHEISRAIATFYDPTVEDFYSKIQLYVQRYPHPPYQRADFLFYLQIIFPLNFLLSFLSISLELTKDIVKEKEKRLKEIMRIMGLRDWMHWLSWFIFSLGWNLVFASVIVAILCVPFDGEAILNFSNPILVFLFTMSYVLSIVTYCFLISTLPKVSERANFSGTVAGAIYFLLFLPYYFVNFNYDDIPLGWKLACALSFNVNMPFGLMILSKWENNRVGLHWSNVWTPISSDDQLTFGHVLIMFYVTSIIHFILALYLDVVFPGKCGIPKKWYFFLQPSFWFTKRSSDEEKSISSNGIQIINLCKSYNGGKTYAVKKLKLNLLPNQITVLLGHNGAGKTTLMSMLCGLIEPTSGSAYLGGLSLRRQMEEVRQNLGICPQFDILFDHLTVEEHFWFYCKIKNIDDNLIEEEIDSMLGKLDLQSKRRLIAKNLSGGMKRKLSVGIALAGNSKFVLLDEATSGMDVSARRFIWDLLISEKRNRTILLSTHFMEEADMLGDKIAIMKQGQLQCFGSPYQLRKDFQIGYLLKISIEKNAGRKEKIIDAIKSHVDQAQLLASTNNEISLSLPENQAEKFESLFSIIEENSTEFGVDNFGISVSTIEEVFLRANQFPFEYMETKGDSSLELIDKIKHDSLKHSSQTEHFFQIFRSQFIKKSKFLIRNRFLLIAHFLLPSIVLIIGILSGTGVINNLTNSPPLHIDLEPYKIIYATSFALNNPESEALAAVYRDVLEEIPNVIVNNITTSNIETEAINYLAEEQGNYTLQNELHHLLSAIFVAQEDVINITALFNNQAYHSSTISMAFIDEALLRYSLNRSDFVISFWNQPLPKKSSDTINAREFDSVFQTHILSCLQISICFLMASFSLMLVLEKSSNFKFIQQISGLKMYQYWISNFIMDFILYVLSAMLLAFILYIFNVKALSSLKHQAFIILMFALNGLSSLPFIYLLAHLFKDQYTAYVQITLVFFLTGFSTFIAVLLLRIGEFNLFKTSELLDTLFTFMFPVYTVTMSIFSIYDNYVGLGVCFSKINVMNMTISIQDLCYDENVDQLPKQILYCCKGKCSSNCFRFQENYWSFETPGVGKYITGSLVLSIVFWTTLAILEGRIGKHFMKMRDKLLKIHKNNPSVVQKSTIRRNIDDDVLAEENRIAENYPETMRDYAMIVKNVSKNFGKFKAVKNISFAVERQECFGLLGENGAGKTTTFKMITGALKLTNGDIWINNFNTKEQMSHVFKDIGYCPQFDGVLDELTGRETLQIICRIRGIKEALINQQIDRLGELLQFTKYLDRVVEEYSGGTKRKLSFAIAIAGNPLITFLDEPTTGIDPISRRGLWNAIRLVRSGGSSLVLTSHSMEECEALCNRLAIMVNGKIRCIGSPLHLKRKFGNGHIVQIKLKSVANSTKPMTINQVRMISACKEIALQSFMEKNFTCQLESKYDSLFTFRILSNDVKLSTMFGKIEKSKRRLNIEHYSINQPSLEKIFLSFATKGSKTNERRNSSMQIC